MRGRDGGRLCQDAADVLRGLEKEGRLPKDGLDQGCIDQLALLPDKLQVRHRRQPEKMAEL